MIITADIVQILKDEGFYAGGFSGNSMAPTLCAETDTALIVPAVFPLKKYDVAVYRGKDGFVMHRVIGVNGNSYDVLGDNNGYIEKDIPESMIVGVLKGFYRGDDYFECTDEFNRECGEKSLKKFPNRKRRYAAKRLWARIRRQF